MLLHYLVKHEIIIIKWLIKRHIVTSEALKSPQLWSNATVYCTRQYRMSRLCNNTGLQVYKRQSVRVVCCSAPTRKLMREKKALREITKRRQNTTMGWKVIVIIIIIFWLSETSHWGALQCDSTGSMLRGVRGLKQLINDSHHIHVSCRCVA